MAPDDLHAVKLLLTLLVPVTVVLAVRRVRPDLRRWTLAGFVLLSGISTNHWGIGANPATQAWLPWMGIALATLFVASPRVLIGLSVIGIAASAHLSHEFVDLADGESFTGDPVLAAHWAQGIARSDLERIQEAAIDAQISGRDPPPVGWLETASLRLGPASEVPTAFILVAEARWHTAFTRLWGADRIRLRLWYPGDGPGSVADRIVWRRG